MIMVGKFEKAGAELGLLVEEKQKAYGDSITKIGKLLRVFLSNYYAMNVSNYEVTE